MDDKERNKKRNELILFECATYILLFDLLHNNDSVRELLGLEDNKNGSEC